MFRLKFLLTELLMIKCGSPATFSVLQMRCAVHYKDTLADPLEAEFLEGGFRGGVRIHDVGMDVLPTLGGQYLTALARHQAAQTFPAVLI